MSKYDNDEAEFTAVEEAVGDRLIKHPRKVPFKNKYLPVEKVVGWLKPNTKGFTVKKPWDKAQNTIFQEEQLGEMKDPRFAESNEHHEVGHSLMHRGTKAWYENQPLDRNAELGVSADEANRLEQGLKEAMATHRQSIEKDFPHAANAYTENPKGAPFYEIMATLNQIEDTYGVDLRKDPRFREVFQDPVLAEIYNSQTGYRRTRMDARDPSPFTPNLKSLNDDRGFLERLFSPRRKHGYEKR